MTNAMLIMALLIIKHYICDFVLQTSYQYKNKGIYGHLGGLLHAGIHLLGTFAVLIFMVPLQLVVICAVIDGVVHYHIDWAKAKLNSYFQLSPVKHSDGFWALFGFDQCLHQLTYVGLLVFVIL